MLLCFGNVGQLQLTVVVLTQQWKHSLKWEIFHPLCLFPVCQSNEFLRKLQMKILAQLKQQVPKNFALQVAFD